MIAFARDSLIALGYEQFLKAGEQLLQNVKYLVLAMVYSQQFI